MKTTRDQCPACGAYSTASYSDGSYECLNCRQITYDPYSPAASAFEASSWFNEPKRRRPRASVQDARKGPSRGSENTGALPAAIPTSRSAVPLQHLISLAGISEVIAVIHEHYLKGGVAMQIWDDNGRLLAATSWIPGVPEGHVAIRDHSANRGCLAELIRLGVVDPPIAFPGLFPICRLRC